MYDVSIRERREAAGCQKDLVAQSVMYDASIWERREAAGCHEKFVTEKCYV